MSGYVVPFLDEAQTTRMRAEDFDRSKNHCHDAAWNLLCKRRQCLFRLRPDLAKEIELKNYQRMEEGHRQEALMRQEMVDAGFKLWHPGRVEWEEFELTNEIDDMITENPKGERQKIVLDYKSCDPYVFRDVRRMGSYDDLLGSKYWWLKHYPIQMLLGQARYKNQEGLLVFKDKSGGGKHEVFGLLDDHKELLREVLARMKEVNKHVAEHKAPAAVRIPECEKCEFLEFCFPDSPPMEGEAPMKRISGEEAASVITSLERMAELEPLAKEYEDLKGGIKSMFKGESVRVGDWIIKSTQVQKRAYKVPDEIKKEYEYINTYFTVRIISVTRPI